MTSVGSQLLLDWGEFLVYVVDHPQGEVHNLASRFWKIQVLQALAPLFGEQVPLLGVTVVEELGVDALLVCATLLDHALPRPHKGPKLLDVRRWDPRLGQPPDQEQLPQVLGIEAIGHGPLLAASERHGVRRLGPGAARIPLSRVLRPRSASPWWPPARKPLACRRTEIATSANAVW